MMIVFIAENAPGRISTQMEFFRFSSLTYVMYCAAMPPLKNIVNVTNSDSTPRQRKVVREIA